MIAMDHTIAGAASGETAITCGAEGFTISGKRTEEYEDYLLFYSNRVINIFCYSYALRDWRDSSLFFIGLLLVHCFTSARRNITTIRGSFKWHNKN